MEGRTVYRIQDKDGRGPWKPGFSHKWCEKTDEDLERLPPGPFDLPMVDLPPAHMRTRLIDGLYWGYGCNSKEHLRMWFSKSEYKKLKKFGYRSVELWDCLILGESKVQILFRRYKPLNQGLCSFRLY